MSVSIPAGYVKIETIEVDARTSGDQGFSTPLTVGASYFVVSGKPDGNGGYTSGNIYGNTAGIGVTSSNAKRRTDALKFDDFQESGVYSRWTAGNAGRFTFSGVADGDGDGSLYWGGVYQSDHIYGQKVIATANDFGVVFRDTPLTDNSGYMTLELWRAPAEISISLLQDGSEDDGPKPAKFQVTRTGDLSESLDVYYQINDIDTVGSEDYVAPVGVVTFDGGFATAEIEIAPVDDELPEYNEDFEVQLLPSSAGVYLFAQAPATPRATAKILDNDVRIRVVSTDLGRIGDMVPSTLGANGLKHFVTPKQDSAEESDPVSIETNLPTPIDIGKFEQSYKWDGKGTENNFGDGVWVYRGAGGGPGDAGRYDVSLSRVADNKKMDELIAWVVWAPFTQGVGGVQYAHGMENGVSMAGVRALSDALYTVTPTSIITDEDRPNLQGLPAVWPPSAPVESGLFNAGENLRGGIDAKWDTTRQLRYKVINPNNIDLSIYKLPNGDPAFADYSNWPSDLLIGNDDTGVGDEYNNPYLKNAQYPAHSLYSSDAPNIKMADAVGVVGDTIEVRHQFRDLARLAIGSKWYRISEAKPWRFTAKMIKVDEAIVGNKNGGNTSAVCNDRGFQAEKRVRLIELKHICRPITAIVANG